MIRTLFLLFLALVVSCKPSGDRRALTDSKTPQDAGPSISQFEGPAALLLQQLKNQGDYVNSRQFPSMIKAETVYEELGGNNLVVDLRNHAVFEKGHIKAAVNVPMNGLLHYFENDILPFQYDKIILVCYGGHISGYATQLMRLMGYGNVYSMRWGMSGWNTDFAGDFWMKGIGSEYQERLERETNPKPPSLNQPFFETSLGSGEEILRERVSGLLANGAKDIFAGNKEIFELPEDYFIMNFERRDKYESGHIPGAVRYKQQGTLGIPLEMGTLPTDRPIIVYCGTGMSSAFAVAYLRLFGYDARSLSYGNNGFMHQKMLAEKEQLSWHPFTESIPLDYPYVKGK